MKKILFYIFISMISLANEIDLNISPILTVNFDNMSVSQINNFSLDIKTFNEKTGVSFDFGAYNKRNTIRSIENSIYITKEDTRNISKKTINDNILINENKKDTNLYFELSYLLNEKNKGIKDNNFIFKIKQEIPKSYYDLTEFSFKYEYINNSVELKNQLDFKLESQKNIKEKDYITKIKLNDKITKTINDNYNVSIEVLNDFIFKNHIEKQINYQNKVKLINQYKVNDIKNTITLGYEIDTKIPIYEKDKIKYDFLLNFDWEIYQLKKYTEKFSVNYKSYLDLYLITNELTKTTNKIGYGLVIAPSIKMNYEIKDNLEINSKISTQLNCDSSIKSYEELLERIKMMDLKIDFGIKYKF